MRRIEPELVLKTTPPRRQKTARSRDRLSIDCVELADKVAIAVHGPAGFGKTTLLAQWRSELLSRGAVVAWLMLDGHDDGARFTQGLAAAMAIGSGRQAFADMLERMPDYGREEWDGLTYWLAEVADLGSETALILDDADGLPESTVRHSLTYLLHNAPANLRIVIASRRQLNLQVADMLARGLYVRVATDALRFRIEETVAILSSRFGARIDTDLCVRLNEITEGWPLGLQLAIAAIEKSSNLSVAIDGLSARSGDIQRYFVDSLMSRLTAEQVDFLICIALLDMLHPSLCTALTGNEAAGEMLKELCSSTPIFIEGIDSDWVRLHPLAREFLQGLFTHLPLPQRQVFHERAAGWLEQHDFFEQAARQYLLAGRATQAYEMIEQCLYEIMLRGQFSRVLEWVAELPRAEVESRPRMCLAAAWSLAMSERHVEAARLIVRIQQDPTANEEMRVEAALIAANAAFFADRPDESLAIITPWMDTEICLSIKLKAVLAIQIARMTLLQGQPEKARRILQRAPHYEWSSGLDVIRGSGGWGLGMTYLCEGRMLPAETVLRDNLLRAEQDIGRRSSVAVRLACGLAAVLYERDQIQEAATVLANRLDVVEGLSSPDAIVLGFLTASRIAGLQGQGHRGHDLLEALFALGEERGIARFCLVSLGEQIRLNALHDRGDTCQSLWRRMDELLPDVARQRDGLLGPELSLIAGMANAYVALVQRDWQTVLDVLVVVNETAEGLRRGREIVQAKLLKALALKISGGDGLPFLLEAISLAEEYGLKRTLEDTHPDLVNWAKKVPHEPAQSPVSTTRHPVPASRPEMQTSASASRLLTPKEREVLQLLARNLSNKQIALTMNVGDQTVKWHLKNLFGKFQAGTRKHVVDRAYMLGILKSEG